MKGATRREAGGVLHQCSGGTHLGHAEGQDVVDDAVQGRDGGVYGIEPVDGDVPVQDFLGGRGALYGMVPNGLRPIAYPWRWNLPSGCVCQSPKPFALSAALDGSVAGAGATGFGSGVVRTAWPGAG